MSHDPTTRDEFYIGYQDQAPPGVGGFVRRWVILAALIAVATAAGLASLQRPFDVAFFDYGVPRSYEGVVRLVPHPVLEVERPGRPGDAASASRYLLVAFGKQGADAAVGAFDGRLVRLEATPIYRDDQTMLEIVAGSVVDIGAPGAAHRGEARPAEARPAEARPAEAAVSLGAVTLEGEIVDSKCHLGVMKPGESKPHRACAALCIRGGIPPILRLRDGDLPVAHLLLVGPRGEAVNDAVLDVVAEPVRVRGELVRMGDLYILRADLETLERL